jgi:hypothetical protein
MLDNHTINLGIQDKNFVLQVARREEEEIISYPRVRYKPSSYPCGKNNLLQHSALEAPTS